MDLRHNAQGEERLRPIDLARDHGLSSQAVRNYEDDGILPPADRSPSGYRRYTTVHARALDAFVALTRGHGHQGAAGIMRAVNRGSVDEALRLVDESHAVLLDDRSTLRSVERALGDLAGQAGAVDAPRGASFIGPLARRLGIKPATLRAWERAGVVSPRRDRLTGYRVYDAADVRDVRLAHQLRRGGYLLGQIAPLIAQVRSAGGVQPLEAAVLDWHRRLDARGRAMLSGAARLDAYLAERERRSAA